MKCKLLITSLIWTYTSTTFAMDQILPVAIINEINNESDSDLQLHQSSRKIDIFSNREKTINLNFLKAPNDIPLLIKQKKTTHLESKSKQYCLTWQMTNNQIIIMLDNTILSRTLILEEKILPKIVQLQFDVIFKNNLSETSITNLKLLRPKISQPLSSTPQINNPPFSIENIPYATIVIPKLSTINKSNNFTININNSLLTIRIPKKESQKSNVPNRSKLSPLKMLKDYLHNRQLLTKNPANTTDILKISLQELYPDKNLKTSNYNQLQYFAQKSLKLKHSELIYKELLKRLQAQEDINPDIMYIPDSSN